MRYNYYNDGGFGPVRLKEPMVLGHEVSGHVAALGEGVEGLSVGELVAISPSRPCHACTYCHQGLRNHCQNMRFYGSAMPFPHIQGAFQEILVVETEQCVKADGLTAAEAAMAEPFSVVLHATRRAGNLLGRRVLITGCGPIGSLAIVAARRAGAAEIVVTDIADNALNHAEVVGADRMINVAKVPDGLEEYNKNKGTFDVHYECSGVQAALVAGIAALRPRGIALQVGVGGDMTLPMMQVTSKEIDIRGCFRFHEEFAMAVQLMKSRLVDVTALVTHTLPVDMAVRAFEIANDRGQAMKTQIAFS